MYRTEARPIKYESKAIDLSTDTVIEVVNGIISRIAFPCYYFYRLDGLPIGAHRIPSVVWDHFGWPRPDKPDHSWQPSNIEGLAIDPIMLHDEGYSSAQLVMKDPPDGLDCVARIDGHIVRVTLDVMCDDAISERVDVPYSLYVSGSFADGTETRDLVTKGIIRIHPTIHEEE